jgi:ribosomal protein S5
MFEAPEQNGVGWEYNLRIVVEAVGVDDISQKEQGKDQGLNSEIEHCLSG